MVFSEGDDFRALRRPGDDPAQFRSLVRLPRVEGPDSIEHQYRVKNFTTSTWPDSAQNADMSVNGLSRGTIGGEPSVSSDGVDDFGVAPSDTVETLPGTSSEFGVAFTVQTTDNSGDYFGVQSSTARFLILDGGGGDIRLGLEENSDFLTKKTTSSNLTDGVPHLICINKRGNNASDIKFYIDQMGAGQQASDTIVANDPFKDSKYKIKGDKMAFFALDGGTSDFKKYDAGLFEFNRQPYSEEEREALKERRPEV
jgi:hypothetical protein